MQKILTFFSKNIRVYAIFNDQSFNDTLTNGIVSFEQLGPDIQKTHEWRYAGWSGLLLFRCKDTFLTLLIKECIQECMFIMMWNWTVVFTLNIGRLYLLPLSIALSVVCLTADPMIASLNPSSATWLSLRLIMKSFLLSRRAVAS